MGGINDRRIMNEQQLRDRMEEIASEHSGFDFILAPDFFAEDEDARKVRGSQVELIRKILSLFKDLRWQVALNGYKTLAYDKGKAIDQHGCGTAVKVRPCGDSKTYFGILLGNIPLSLGASIDGDVLTVMRSFYNPAIFVPELSEVVFGSESWWGEIEGPEELDWLITDESIEGTWYVALLKEMVQRRGVTADTAEKGSE
jgi:hypothetical protein